MKRDPPYAIATEGHRIVGWTTSFLSTIAPARRARWRIDEARSALRHARRSGPGQGLHAARGAEQQQVRRTRRKQAIGDHADDGVDVGLQLHRVKDVQVV